MTTNDPEGLTLQRSEAGQTEAAARLQPDAAALIESGGCAGLAGASPHHQTEVVNARSVRLCADTFFPFCSQHLWSSDSFLVSFFLTSNKKAC